MSVKFFDFGDGKGPVPAHRHPNGGGWVADSAYVSEKAYVGEHAKVAGGTIKGGTIEGGTIWGGTIEGGTIWGGTIRGGTIRGGTIRGGTITRDVTYIVGCVHYSVTITDDFVGIGCQWHAPTYWRDKGEAVFESHGQSPEDARKLHALLMTFINMHGCVDAV